MTRCNSARYDVKTRCYLSDMMLWPDETLPDMMF